MSKARQHSWPRFVACALAFLFYCAVLLSASAETNLARVLAEVPIKTTHGDLLVQTRVNGSEPLSFKLDTGFGITVINPNRVDGLNLEKAGEMTIIGIAGKEKADVYRGATFEFGNLKYEARRVAALPSEARRRWRNRDGILGAGFFRKYVVELDVPKHRMRLFAPDQFVYNGAGDMISISFKKDTPIVDATIVAPGNGPISGRFEIDTGCDDCVCLGHEFVSANHLVDEDAGTETRHGVGGSADIKSGHLAELRLGKQTIKQPTANFFLDGSPAGEGQAGHIGLGVLERYRVILDYSRLQMILEASE
ncbi:MAG TPA: pepsin/retropepsin-like aspartic protease family protein [Candidatus Dormibacteraeota bacterium]|nr:pepsin/retropepsin-like aspartic protease family protein [Candidatus Dormibacteraeota bacterium]